DADVVAEDLERRVLDQAALDGDRRRRRGPQGELAAAGGQVLDQDRTEPLAVVVENLVAALAGILEPLGRAVDPLIGIVLAARVAERDIEGRAAGAAGHRDGALEPETDEVR